MFTTGAVSEVGCLPQANERRKEELRIRNEELQRRREADLAKAKELAAKKQVRFW